MSNSKGEKIVENTSLKKQSFRREILERRINMEQADVDIKSRQICDVLLNELARSQYKAVIFYYPLKNEVNLLPMIHELINDESVSIGFPYAKDGNYDFGAVNHCDFQEKWDFYANFFSGKYGVKEPKVYSKWSTTVETLILVPGLAFDKKGVRLGFGKGNYDRLLDKYKGKRIGVAYDWQLIEDCPKESHDKPMDMVVTEKGVWKNHE